MKKNTLWLTVASILSFAQIINTCAVSQNCSSNCSDSPCSNSKNTWLPRAFSSDASREITLEKNVFQTDSARTEWFGTFSFATQYMQNFGSKCNSCKNLGSLVFWGAAGNNTMTIGNNDGRADVDAWNFGLGNVQVDENGIGGTITLNPKVTQAGTDFMLYFTHKKDERGLYFKVHAPVGAMIINPQLTETGTKIDTTPLAQTTNASTNPVEGASAITYNTDYPNPVNRATSMTSAFAGGLGDGNSLNGLRRMWQIELDYGRIAAYKRTEIRLADLSVVLGYNLFANEKGLIGLGFKATCPTGNVPTGQFALEPIFGRGGAWGVGADIMAHYKVWENDASTKFLDVWFQGDVLHLLPGRTGHRSFDLLANGKGSKYILLQHFHTNTDGVVGGGALTQAVNVTTLPVYSKFAVEGSAALMADFHCHNWNFAVSGEFWGRTKETLSINLSECVDRQKENLNNYGVVGRQANEFNILSGGQAGRLGNNNALTPANTPYFIVPLVEPAAKINASQNPIILNGGAGNTPVYFPTATNTPNLPASTTLVDGRISANRIPADLNEALDICGAAAARAFTGKIFGQFGYTFNDCRYTPNLAFIGGAEFTNSTNAAVQMWSVGLQGSINF